MQAPPLHLGRRKHVPQIRLHLCRRGPNARTAATDRGSLAQGEEEEITCSNCSTSYPTLLDANHTPALLLFNNSSPKYNHKIQLLRRLTCCIWWTASACPSVASGRCPRSMGRGHLYTSQTTADSLRQPASGPRPPPPRTSGSHCVLRVGGCRACLSIS